MEIIKTEIPGLLVIKPRIFPDERGYFFECYNQDRYQKEGIESQFIQDNEAESTFGVIRGLHYQLNPFAQAKLVRVIKGRVYDVAVDIRKGSPTFGKWYGIELSEENKHQLYVPRGFAHGYSVLEDNTIFSYKCDNLYTPDKEASIIFNDPTLNIDWKIPAEKQLVSEKDFKCPTFENAIINFKYE